ARATKKVGSRIGARGEATIATSIPLQHALQMLYATSPICEPQLCMQARKHMSLSLTLSAAARIHDAKRTTRAAYQIPAAVVFTLVFSRWEIHQTNRTAAKPHPSRLYGDARSTA
ncbi:unnamed protein product, partial [Ectocarpus sp. 12 AP-2014]